MTFSIYDPYSFPRGHVNIEVVSEEATNDVSIVALGIHIHGERFKVTGSAKREPGDKSDKSVGLELAWSRALSKAAKKLEKRAWGKNKHNCDMKAYKTAQKSKADFYETDESIEQIRAAWNAGDKGVTLNPNNLEKKAIKKLKKITKKT